MSQDHDRIEELLAGYVLLGLTGEDAIEADRLLSEHVPVCPMCRETMAGFQAVAGDLALAPDPAVPSELILPKIRRALAEAPARRRQHGAGRVVMAASVAAFVGLAGFTLSLGNRATKAESQRARLVQTLNAMQQPGANPVSLSSGAPSGGGLVEIAPPGTQRMYIFGTEVPAPAPGHAYQLWLGAAGTFVAVGTMFEPEEGGVVVIPFTVDPSRYDEILITEEVAGSTPSAPSNEHRWGAVLSTSAAA